MPDVPRPDRVGGAVLALATVGLLARVSLLGARPAHFDEARVAYWTLHTARTGEFHYRFAVHGPLLQHAARTVFAVLGPTDIAMRLPVAVVGGTLPLVALFLRHRLGGTEVIALAALLAFDPLLLYYGRFARSTVLVSGFCLLAFVAFVRLYDGFGPQYLHLGVVALALGFAAKENALLYVLCWLGAAALLVDAKLFRLEGTGSGVDRLERWSAEVAERLRARGRDPGRHAVAWAGHALAATVLFLAVSTFLYAPRGGEWMGLYDALADPAELPTVLGTTAGQVADGYGYWLGGGGETSIATGAERLGYLSRVVAGYAWPLLGLAVAGTALERYGRVDPRLLVLGCAYWGFVSIPGYALGTDIANPWVLANALVPLAVPAAVGLGAVADAARGALATGDRARAGVTAAVLLLVAGGVVSGAATGVYANPTSPGNALVQFAQPSGAMAPAVDGIAAAAEEGTDGNGTDVLLYGGEAFVDADGSAPRTPACLRWFDTLPLGWYLEANDLSATCATTPAGIPDRPPPVVVVPGDCTLGRPVRCRDRHGRVRPPATVADRMTGYERYAFLHRTTGGPTFDGMVVFVDRDRVDDA